MVLGCFGELSVILFCGVGWYRFDVDCKKLVVEMSESPDGC